MTIRLHYAGFYKDSAQNKIIKNNGANIIHIYDQFDQSLIDEIILNHPETDCIVSDHIVYENCYNFFGRQFVGLPIFLINELRSSILPCVDSVESLITEKTCNFIVNKKQINRFLCIKLAEWFELKCNYTWSGVDNSFDMSEIINELNNDVTTTPFTDNCRSFLLGPITTPSRFVGGAFKMPPGLTNDIRIHNYGGSGPAWKNGLNQVFLTSAVSLITESVRFQKLAILTEKTGYSVLGCTFPIWVGGFNQAQQWKSFGFDIFEDIIDHSYEQYPTLIERCYYAFKKNLHILTDLEMAKKLRLENMNRLLNNRELLINNHLSDAVFQRINDLPCDLKDGVTIVVKQLLEP